MRDHVHVADAERYVEDVLAGHVVACRWIKLACERHRRDLKASKRRGALYYFDPEKGDRPCRFAEKLPHVKGKWARRQPGGKQQTLKLEPWQKFVLVSIFGWLKRSNGKRRFTKARIYLPRKNGKSFLAAVIGWYMFALDGEPGAEVYSGATSEKQAWEVFGPARQMAIMKQSLAEGLGATINAQSLVLERDNSRFLPVIGNPGDGASPHCAIVDEFHEHKTSDLIDTMATGMGAREQPLELVISTAGSNLAGPCREDWKSCERILENTGGFSDDSCFCVIWTIDKGDAWDTEDALKKANPNWGVSINEELILAELKSAKQVARKQSAYRTKYLNEWVSAKEGFFNVAEWADLGTAKPREDYKEFPSYLAGDLASKHDLVALMQLFVLPDKRFAVFGKYFLPAATIELPENQHYRNWVRDGWLEIAGDKVTDLEEFKEHAKELCATYQVDEFPFDPNRAWGVFPALEAEGLPVVEYRNTVMTMSEPMKQLDALIRSGRIVHNGDPVLAWAIANVTGKYDKKDNVFPNKEANQNKIDPVIGLLMALGRAMTRDDDATPAFFSF